MENFNLSALDRVTDKLISYHPARKQPEAKKLKNSTAKVGAAAPKKEKRDV